MMTQIGRCIQFLTLLFLCSCAPATLSDLRSEGEAETRKLVGELREVEKREDLQKILPKLKKRFVRLAELLVKVRAFPKEELAPTAASEELFLELARLYEMPGGRELIESAQTEAVQQLKR